MRFLESQSRKSRSAEIFIETPYRNRQVYAAACQALAHGTKLTIAIDLTGKTEFVKTRTIEEWKKSDPPEMHKIPAVFIIQAK